MKTETNAGYIARLAITLLLITAVVAAALAAVNSITAPKIHALNEQKTQAAIEAVLPGGGELVDYPTTPASWEAFTRASPATLWRLCPPASTVL